MLTFNATYSPDDNKLRLYASGRLDKALYDRVRATGFIWAPKQELFVAPMWTPSRADLCEELAGEIGDEDKNLVERAEERAERFEEYSEKRAADADNARRHVSSIADGIPFGQPILIGHHSERHARRDAEKIENGMRRAVKMWETSKYWIDRAQGALAHAQHAERADVRARRIKKIEAEARKIERERADAATWLQAWNKTGLTLEQARHLANYCRLTVTRTNSDGTPRTYGGWSAYDVLQPDGERYQACPAVTVEECIAAANRQYTRTITHCARWAEHYAGRLSYERAMLGAQGGTAADKWKFEIGGKVLRRGSWYTIVRVNAESVSVSGHFATTVTHDEIKDYQPPTQEQAAAVAQAMKTPPICNYPGEGYKHMTQADFDARKEKNWSDFPKTKHIAATDTAGAHRVRCARGEKQWDCVPVYITDAKRKDPPSKQPAGPSLKPERAGAQPIRQREPEPAGAAAFNAMRESLRAGVQVITAPQLFPTPLDLAARMVELAGVEPGERVLEPSAGTGNIAAQVARNTQGSLLCVEVNPTLCSGLQRAGYVVQSADFLETSPEDLGGVFDCVIMNPPFENAADIKHILHAQKFLRDGGRLVAICADGPRQRAALMPLADLWEDLPQGTFKNQGTNVNTALVVIQG